MKLKKIKTFVVGNPPPHFTGQKLHLEMSEIN